VIAAETEGVAKGERGKPIKGLWKRGEVDSGSD